MHEISFLRPNKKYFDVLVVNRFGRTIARASVYHYFINDVQFSDRVFVESDYVLTELTIDPEGECRLDNNTIIIRVATIKE